jgi:predicted nucleic acid-binding protein
MRFLLDTNILTRLASPDDHLARIADNAVQALTDRGDTLVVVPQNLYEFWSVATRPLSNNGLGMSGPQAHAILEHWRGSAEFVPDNLELTDRWQQLVLQHDVKGKNAHDARLVAAMMIHGIPTLLTFNTRDFARYGIHALDPAQVASAGGQL